MHQHTCDFVYGSIKQDTEFWYRIKRLRAPLSLKSECVDTQARKYLLWISSTVLLQPWTDFVRLEIAWLSEMMRMILNLVTPLLTNRNVYYDHFRLKVCTQPSYVYREIKFRFNLLHLRLTNLPLSWKLQWTTLNCLTRTIYASKLLCSVKELRTVYRSWTAEKKRLKCAIHTLSPGCVGRYIEIFLRVISE